MAAFTITWPSCIGTLGSAIKMIQGTSQMFYHLLKCTDEELALWCSRLSLHVWHHIPYESASSNTSCLLMRLGRQERMTQVLGSLQPHGRPKRNPCLPTPDRPSSSHRGHLGSESGDGRPLSVSLSLTLSFK